MNRRPPAPLAGPSRISTNRRLSLWYAVVIFVIGVIIIRLFYLQIIRHDYYREAALNDQLKQYTVAADRGLIEAHQGDTVIPLVLNQKLYTLYADPSLVKDPAGSALKLAKITHGKAEDYADLMKTKHSRYQVLAQRLSIQQQQQILDLKLSGVGAQAQDYRTYPQGELAAQVLGFVDNSGAGRYGIEQQFNSRLAGTPGMLKAITDVNGVPLAASRDNVQVNPKPGDNIVLTIDTAMQRQLELILKQGLQKIGSNSGSALILDPNTGDIKAMANFPTYDPSKFFDVKDLSAFNNSAVASPLEVGSIMKTLTVSTGLNQGTITPDSAYHDPGSVTVDGATIKNVLSIPHDPTTIQDVLKYSLNTGAVHVLKTLGGSDNINQKGRDTLYDYYTNHFGLGKLTGIEQPTESAGIVPNPDKGDALNLKYANMAFGQGLTATITQMAAAFSSIVNGGTYYQPHLVDAKPKIIRQNTVKQAVSADMQQLLEYVYTQNHNVYQSNLHPGYNVGGKTGTGQIPYKGGYKDGVYNGTYLGFVGGDTPQYVVAVLVNAPNLPGFESAGSQGAAPIFGKIADALINDFGVSSISNQ
jgi:cell division protein FtsI/penicillin-binding protein 2